MNHFSYNSSQTHFTTVNGVRKQVTEEVSIRNGKGMKRVMTRTNGASNAATKKLSKKEVKNILNRKFMPSLFAPCHAAAAAAAPPNAAKRKTRKRAQKKKEAS